MVTGIFIALCAVGDVFWDVAYVLIIRKGFKDRSYGVPMLALTMNYVWETLFTFVYPPLTSAGQVDFPKATLYGVWFVLDTVIVFQLLRYGRDSVHTKPFPYHRPRNLRAVCTWHLPHVRIIGVSTPG